MDLMLLAVYLDLHLAGDTLFDLLLKYVNFTYLRRIVNKKI